MKKRNFFDKIASISVIIPAYNRAGLIGETLRSLLSQTISAKEVIVVDDGSTDGTAQAVERELLIFREQFSRNSKSNVQNPTLKILRQQNAGPGAARNRGLAEATGEFIHFFDSDDIAAPNKHGHENVEEVSTTDDTDKHGYQNNQHGNAQGTYTSDAFSNTFPSELARDCENTSPTRSASGPAEAMRAETREIGSAGGNQLADSKEFLEGQSQAGLQMDSQKHQFIRTANDPSASVEFSSFDLRPPGQPLVALPYACPSDRLC